MDNITNMRRSKKTRLIIIVGLLILVGVIAFFFEKTRVWMIGVAVLLAVALGFEVAETDIDLGTVLETGSISDSVIERDENGDLVTTEAGDFITSIWRDQNGNEVPEGTAGAKGEDEYNCDDFSTQGEAQVFFDNAGGVDNDVNRLDGNKDGVACQSLPAGS